MDLVSEHIIPADFQDKILTGKEVKIWPWARGYYPRDVLFFLWRMMEQEGMTETVFYAQTSTTEKTPVSTHMDLIEFVHFFADSQHCRLLLIPMHQQSGEMVGFQWYDNVVMGQSALGNMFYRRKFWGDVGHEATYLALKYAFEILQLKKVWGQSPWKASVAHRGRLGFEEIAEVPEAVVDTRGKTHPLYVGVLTKEKFYGQR